MDQMLVRVEVQEAWDRDRDSAARELGNHLRSNLGVRLDTEVLVSGALPRYELKTKRTFDHRLPEERPKSGIGRTAS